MLTTIIIMMTTIIVSYFVYHVGKQVGINKRNKELLNNINKFDKEKTDEKLIIDVKTGMWSVKKNNKKNDK
jgi:hypothetical protein